MSRTDRSFGLAEARRFIERAEWTYATTYSKFAEHAYTTRWSCRARGIEPEFTAFARLIETDGWWRIWGRHRWRSFVVGDWTFWLYRIYEPAERRTVINGWETARMDPEAAQLTLLDD